MTYTLLWGTAICTIWTDISCNDCCNRHYEPQDFIHPTQSLSSFFYPYRENEKEIFGKR